MSFHLEHMRKRGKQSKGSPTGRLQLGEIFAALACLARTSSERLGAKLAAASRGPAEKPETVHL